LYWWKKFSKDLYLCFIAEKKSLVAHESEEMMTECFFPLTAVIIEPTQETYQFICERIIQIGFVNWIKLLIKNRVKNYSTIFQAFRKQA